MIKISKVESPFYILDLSYTNADLSFSVSANQTVLMLIHFEPEGGIFNLTQK